MAIEFVPPADFAEEKVIDVVTELLYDSGIMVVTRRDDIDHERDLRLAELASAASRRNHDLHER